MDIHRELAIFDSVINEPLNKNSTRIEQESKLYDSSSVLHHYTPGIDERMLEVFCKAENPEDPIEILNLFLGRVEAELGQKQIRPELATLWNKAKFRRNITVEELLSSNVTIGFIKELFNFYFRDDLYGRLESDKNIILSSGAVCEDLWGLPEIMKECLRFALNKNWYGYSDSRGRESSRIAIADYENIRMGTQIYDVNNVVITMGATFAINSLADFILTNSQGSEVLCGIPNYPPLVKAIALRHNVKLVPIQTDGVVSSIRNIIDALKPDTPMVMIQTVLNPNGTLVNENEIKELISKASPNTMIILDECHELLGPKISYCKERAAENVIRISSLSKKWAVPGLKIGWFIANKNFIKKFYEFASTTYGGPPSFYFTLLEFLARMESWLLNDVEELTPADVDLFNADYKVKLNTLQKAYATYKDHRIARREELYNLKGICLNYLANTKAQFIMPNYSINIGLEYGGHKDSYGCFRELLHQKSVSFYPGILNFCMSGSLLRMTFTRPVEEIKESLQRLSHI
jgi:aspartate/methionine/tyrosine aminotransferase